MALWFTESFANNITSTATARPIGYGATPAAMWRRGYAVTYR
jgi:hypothetical protein